MRRFFVLASLLLASGATGLRAQSELGDEFNPYHLGDTIVVTANRLATPLREVAASVTVVTAEQIERSQATMVSDILRSVPGLSVVQAGGPGQQTSIFMRGANSEHVLVLVDGVKLNDPSSPSNAVNLANVPADNIQRIEILRGPQSVLYGSDAVGGVIRIFTKCGLGKPKVNLTAEGGSFGTFRESLSLSSGQDDVDYSVVLSRVTSDGVSAISGPGALERDGYANNSLNASFGLRPSGRVQMRFSGRFIEADTDLDQALDDPNYIMNSRERSFSAGIQHEISPGRWWQQFGFYITRYQRSAVDGIDALHPSDSSRTGYDGRRVKYDWQSAYRFSPSVRLTLGLESEEDRLDQSLYYGSAYGDYWSRLEDVGARTTGPYTLGEVSLNGRWFATVGCRWDNHETFGDHVTYRVTGVYLADAIGVKLRASYGTGLKVPALFQLYDHATGNTDLKPELSRGWEAGVEQTLASDRLTLGTTYFETRFDDLIRFDGAAWKMVNLAEALARGIEAEAAYVEGKSSIRLDYTYTDAVDRRTDQPLVRRPRHQINLAATHGLTQALDMQAAVLYTGEREDTDYATWPASRVILDDYLVVNLMMQYRLNSAVQIHGRIENLLDADYQEVLSFNCVPFSVSAGVSLTL